MFGLSLIAFQTPLALVALALLPVIWWLLRVTPPRPRAVRFPALRFLQGLKDRLNTPDKSPWWLTALRIVLAAILITALAGPSINPSTSLAKDKATILVILDNGWAAARDWSARRAALDNIAAQAQRAQAMLVLATTAPDITPVNLEPKPAIFVRNLAKNLSPQPFTPQRMALAKTLAAQKINLKSPAIYWLSDGLDYGNGQKFVQALAKIAGPGQMIQIVQPKSGKTALVAAKPRLKDGAMMLFVKRAPTMRARAGMIRAIAENGRTLANVPFRIEPGKSQAAARLNLPLALRNQIVALEIDGEKSAGSIFLLDDRWRQKSVGLATSDNRADAQPLLSAMHYVTRALEIKAVLTKADAGANNLPSLIKGGLSALILDDIGKLQPQNERAVTAWVERGGVLIRFAGARLAGSNDGLIPAKLRRGDRELGGALSWSKAQKLSPFDETSPFFGLKISHDVTILRQVLAEPSTLANIMVWARLEDGTPLVTAAKRGSGLIVLFHVPSSPGWSNLPLSGLFVEMLHKLIDLAPLSVGARERARAGLGAPVRDLGPRKTLDGFGRLENPAPHVQALTSNILKRTAISPRHPPGLYGPENATRALNIGAQDLTFSQLALSHPSLSIAGYGPTRILDLKPPLLLAVFILFLIDALAAFILSGGRTPGRARVAAIILITLSLAGLPTNTALAQMSAPESLNPQSPAPPPPFVQRPQKPPGNITPEDRFALAATGKTRLAYVITGNGRIDGLSLAGLRGLTKALNARTAFEPGPPVGVNLERDELTFFPLLYWPVHRGIALPSPKALAKIDAYMKRGGTILFDTADHQRALPGADGTIISPNSSRLRQLLSKFDIPPLEPIPVNHVLTKAFYLQQDFPGRWTGGPLWVEAAPKQAGLVTPMTKNHDGVTALIIGSNDYASAWAQDTSGKSLYPVVPGGARQREMAFRTGVNIVIYVLTGNYKADQVHIPSLLERLGQ